MYQRTGALWENRIIVDAKWSGAFIQKVPEHMKKNYRSGEVYRVKSCFDFFGSMNGDAFYFDAKSVGTGTFNLNTWLKHYKHQYALLLEAAHKKAVAGLLIWYYKKEQIEFVDIKQIKRFIDQGKKSLKPSDGQYIIPDNERIDFKTMTDILKVQRYDILQGR